MVMTRWSAVEPDPCAAHLRPLPLPRPHLPRERLLHRLDAAIRSRIVLVVAPTGYGKSVLLAEWVAARRRREVRWITAERRDNDPDHFARVLSATLDGDGPVGGRRMLESAGVPRVLVVDDVHEVTNTLAFEWLLSRLEIDPFLHVVLAGRADPSCRIHRFRLCDQVAEIRQRDLVFDEGEAHQLLEMLTRRELDPDLVHRLHARTEGWAAGLHLVGVSLGAVPDTEGFAREYLADDGASSAVLTTKVLELQDQQTRDFLLGTSVLSQMSAALCDHVLERTGSRDVLRGLERTAVVLSTVEGRHEWYRYHGLIRSVLRHQLRGESAERERELLRRAAAWHIERNDVSAAIGYLVEAGEDRAAVDLLSMYGWTEVGARPRTVLDWVERLPLEVRRRDVAVMLLELAARLGLHDSASTTGVVRSLMRAPVTDGEEVARDALGSMWLLHQGQVHDAVRRADRALDRVERLDDDGSLLDAPGARQLIVENAEAAKAEALVFLGDLGGAEKVVSTRFEHGAVVDDVALLGLEAIVAAFAGRLGRATWLAERGLTLADSGSGGRREHAAMCLFAQAVVAREQQRLDQAHELLDLVEDRGTGSPLLAELVSVERIDLSLREDRRPGPAGTIIELRSA